MTPDQPYLSIVDAAWTTADSDLDGYTPDQFYCEAADKKGHSANLSTTIPPGIYSELTTLIESGMIPQYAKKADFLRDAVRHRLAWLAQNVEALKGDKGLQANITMDRLQAKQDYRLDREAQGEAYVENAVDCLAKAAEREDWRDMAGLVNDLTEFHSVDVLPEYLNAMLADMIEKALKVMPQWAVDLTE